MHKTFKGLMTSSWILTDDGITHEGMKYPFSNITDVEEKYIPLKKRHNGVIQIKVVGESKPVLLAYAFGETEEAKEAIKFMKENCGRAELAEDKPEQNEATENTTDDGKLNIEFRNSIKQYLAVTDEKIIFRDGIKEDFIQYSEIVHIKWSLGCVQFQAKYRNYNFAVEKVDKQRMNEAIETVKELMKTASDKTYRKVCKVCGHIFCYTGKDLMENSKLNRDARREYTTAALNILFTSTVVGNQNMQRGDNKSTQMVDYNKCPRCGSEDLADATEEDIQRNQMQGTVQPQISAADELKKFKELLDMEIITQEEFNAKKKQLLGL